MLRKQNCLYRTWRYHLRRASSCIFNWRDHWLDPSAVSFFKEMLEGGFDPETYIDVLPLYRLIYVCVPKSASSTIRSTLSALETGAPPPPELLFKRRFSGLRSPSQVGISTFHFLANSATTLRFAFVRNPYARLVSAWADKFQGKPLVPGDSFIDKYLAHCAVTGNAPLDRPDETLSFPQFVDYAVATAGRRIDAHWQLQDDLIAMPGIMLDLIGKVETFRDNFSRVLDHVGAGAEFLRTDGVALNTSRHGPWPDYYTDALAARVHRAYERDFDRFGYARAIKDTALA